LGKNQGIAVTEKQPPGVGEMAGCIVDISKNNIFRGDGEPLALIHPAKIAFVMGAAGGYLQ
jgi:hypothetical protein